MRRTTNAHRQSVARPWEALGGLANDVCDWDIDVLKTECRVVAAVERVEAFVWDHTFGVGINDHHGRAATFDADKGVDEVGVSATGDVRFLAVNDQPVA